MEWCVVGDVCICDYDVDWVEVSFDLSDVSGRGFIVGNILFICFNVGFCGKGSGFFVVVCVGCCDCVVLCL